MKKIVELLISTEEFESDNLGVSVVSLVSTPAIGYKWMAFNAETFEEVVAKAQEFVMPRPDEDEGTFISRCIPEVEGEGYDGAQAVAICYSYWEGDFEDCNCEKDFALEDACWPGYEAIGMKDKDGKQVPNCVKIENEEFSYTNYPESVKKAAQRGIKLNEAQENKCGTLVGKQRAQQLAKGEAISAETVQRMYSYLSRAGEYYNPSDKEACGTISYLLWGGPDALDWSEKQLETINREKLQMAIIEMAENLGETHDPKTTVYLRAEDFAEDNSTVAGVARAIGALDILGKRGATDEMKEVWKYTGPRAQRKFCRALMRNSETKVYTADEIRSMNRLNPGFGPGGSNSYDVFKWAGGAQCTHSWQGYWMTRSEDGRVVLIENGNNSTAPTDLTKRDDGVLLKGYQSKESRAKSLGGYWGKFSQMDFATVDEEQRIVIAPAMIPNSLIARRDEKNNEYFVYFSKETIKDISEKFFKQNYTNNTDINHDGDITQENTLLESWIKDDDKLDKSSKFGFETTPIGTWFLSYKINDDETWNKIKNGDLQGYSISGNFLELAKN